MSYQIEIRNLEGRVITVVDLAGECPLSIGHWVDLSPLIDDYELGDTAYVVSDIYWTPDEEENNRLNAFVHLSPANSYEDRLKILQDKGWR